MIFFGLIPGISSGAAAAGTITVCPSGCDYTTIQAAVNAASDGDTVQILMTVPHTEADIVIQTNVTIQGISVQDTIVQADTLPGSGSGRVFSVLGGAQVTFRDLTIRYGYTSNEGGGINNNGSQVTLSHVDLVENHGQFGGGISNQGGVLLLEDVTLAQNDTALGGGVYNTGSMTVKGSQFDYNDAAQGGGIYNTGSVWGDSLTLNGNQSFNEGGGVYNTGTVQLTGSQISFNQASGNGTAPGGGGIYNLGDLTLIGSTVDNNTFIGNIGSMNGGGGIRQHQGTLTVASSQLLNNHSNTPSGGGLMVSGGTASLTDTLIQGNDSAFNGGGIYLYGGTLTITYSTIQGNDAGSGGGGIGASGGSLTLSNSTVSANSAAGGGGLFVSQAAASLINSTISGNNADTDGGGIAVYSTLGEVFLANLTISNNTADADVDEDGNGGGIYVDSGALLHLKNSVIAGNQDSSTGLFNKAYDCKGTVNSDGYNLIGTLGTAINGYHCSIAGDTTGNLIGVAADLGSLGDNGGPTWTHPLLPTSPAINAGDPAGCSDYDTNTLGADQRDALRPDRCDMGAFELGGLVEKLYLPLLLKE